MPDSVGRSKRPRYTVHSSQRRSEYGDQLTGGMIDHRWAQHPSLLTSPSTSYRSRPPRAAAVQIIPIKTTE